MLPQLYRSVMLYDEVIDVLVVVIMISEMLAHWWERAAVRIVAIVFVLWSYASLLHVNLVSLLFYYSES